MHQLIVFYSKKEKLTYFSRISGKKLLCKSNRLNKKFYLINDLKETPQNAAENYIKKILLANDTETIYQKIILTINEFADVTLSKCSIKLHAL